MAKKYSVVFIRHGESEWNKMNLFCGWHDVGLSEEGKPQYQTSYYIRTNLYLAVFDLLVVARLTSKVLHLGLVTTGLEAQSALKIFEMLTHILLLLLNTKFQFCFKTPGYEFVNSLWYLFRESSHTKGSHGGNLRQAQSETGTKQAQIKNKQKTNSSG